MLRPVRQDRRALSLFALGAVAAAWLVQCASDDGERVTFPPVNAMVKGASPITTTATGFRLQAAHHAAGPWATPADPRVELPRSASSPMWITSEGAKIGVVHASLGEGHAVLEPPPVGSSASQVVRIDGDSSSARIFTRGSELEEIFYLREPADVAYRMLLPRDHHARLVGSDSVRAFVEIDDAKGEPVLRMRADQAWDARGRALRVITSLAGDSVEVTIDKAERDVVYPVAVDPAWFSASSPIRIRFGQTATLLGSGYVLIAGGDIAAKSSEIYSSVSGHFFPESDMTERRIHHTATLLMSGRVLLAGGEGLKTAEIYDPAKRTFTPTGSMSTVRAGHSAVRLPSGKVLIVGGVTSGADTSTEVYDEATGKFSLLTPRDAIASGSGALVVLPSGKVLFSGHASATQTFDPSANGGMGSWTTASVPPSPSTGHRDAVLLRDGTVLITGGYTCGTTGTPVNCGSHGDIFDPAAGGGLGQPIKTTPDLPGPGASATLLPTGEVLFTGGAVPANVAAVYDPTTNTASSESMPEAHADHTATVLPSGDVLVLGGNQAGVELRPATGKLAPLAAPMTTGRTNHSALRLRSGKVLLVGGATTNGTTASAELFDPLTGLFTATGSMGTPRLRPVLSLLPSGDVLVTGGVNGSDILASAEIYDVVAGTFRAIAPMGAPRSEHAVAPLPTGELLVTGGCKQASDIPGCQLSSMRADSEYFDPKTEKFRPGPPLYAPHADHGMVRLPTGWILLVGDTNAEVYDPVVGFFSYVPGPGAARDGRSAHLLVSGKVFVSGGTTLAAELFDPVTKTWSFGGPVPFTATDIAWTGAVGGNVLSSGGRLFEGVEARGMLFDPLTANGNGEVAFTGTGRASHTATLMSNGGILFTGGDPCWGICVGQPLASAAVWTDGAPTAARPVLTTAPAQVTGGTKLTLVGHGFANAGEGSSGDTAASALNAPQVVWVSEAGDASVLGRVLDFTDTSITWIAPSTALAGHGYLYVLVGGVLSNPAPLEIAPSLLATGCTFDAECASGFCSDNVCCDRRCNGKCEGCTTTRKTNGVDGVCGAVPPGHDSKGLCFALQGQACSDASQCATGFCTEGICCDSACKGTCLSCTQAGHVGACTAISEGACDVACDGDHTLKKVGSPDVDCAPFKCDGKSCRVSCASARDCVAPAVCDEGGLCVPPSEATPSTASVWGCASGGRAPDEHGGSQGAVAILGAAAVALRRTSRRRSPS